MSAMPSAALPERGSHFRAFAESTAHALGSPWAFFFAAAAVVMWALTGPLFHFSETWQLVINTGTTIVTFLMVFLLQNTQVRDTNAIHLKLDELIRAMADARNNLIGVERLPDKALESLNEEFEEIKREAAS